MPWFGTVAVMSVMIWGVVEVVKMLLEHKKGQWKAEGNAQQAQQSERIKALEERIEVLEAIVTDKSYDLKQKINAL